MKKLFGFLLTAALLLTLCACGGTPAPEQTEAPQTSGTPTQEPIAVSQEPTETESSALITGEEAQNADGLNEFGLPDLSGYTAEEIWDMYLHPENWDEAVLTMADGTFEFGDDAPYSDPDVAPDYVFDLGEWHDYDPGDWTPGPDETVEWEIDWPDPSGDETGELPTLPASELPERYAFLLPEGLRDGDMTSAEDGTFFLSLPNRTAEDYAAFIQAAKTAGYTQDAQETEAAGMRVFTAGNGSETVTMTYQNGTVMIVFT